MKSRNNVKPQRVACVNKVKGKWVYRFAFSPVDGGWEYEEVMMNHEPTDEDKRMVRDSYYNAMIRKKIEEGWTWNGINVWLSVENQLNIRSVLDELRLTGVAMLPVTMKLGEDAGGRALYYKFESMEEIEQFYAGMTCWIRRCLTEGWAMKDGEE